MIEFNKHKLFYVKNAIELKFVLNNINNKFFNMIGCR